MIGYKERENPVVVGFGAEKPEAGIGIPVTVASVSGFQSPFNARENDMSFVKAWMSWVSFSLRKRKKGVITKVQVFRF